MHIPLKKLVIFRNKKNTPNSVRLEYTHSRLYLSNYYSKTLNKKLLETLVKKPDDCQNIFLTLLLLFCMLCATLLQTELKMYKS